MFNKVLKRGKRQPLPSSLGEALLLSPKNTSGLSQGAAAGRVARNNDFCSLMPNRTLPSRETTEALLEPVSRLCATAGDQGGSTLGTSPPREARSGLLGPGQLPGVEMALFLGMKETAVLNTSSGSSVEFLWASTPQTPKVRARSCPRRMMRADESCLTSA